MTRPLELLLTSPANRPRTTLGLAALLTLIAVFGASRLQIHATLDAMFPRNDPGAKAMTRVMERFQTIDELLVLVMLPTDTSAPDPDRLTAYAMRFEQAVKSGPAALAGAIVYRDPPDAQQFITHELAPAGLFYLNENEFADAMQRLSPEGMRAQFAHDQAMLSQPGPAAAAISKAMMQDPLALHDFLIPHLTAARPMAGYPGSDALISPDGRAILIRVMGTKPPTDLDYAVALTEAITTATNAAAPGDLRLSLSGAYPIAALSQQSIRRDAVESAISSVALLLGLFVVVYRKPLRMFHLAYIPIAIGTFWGFGVYGLTRRELSPIAAVIGGVLSGMGIDYSVLYLTCYESLSSAGASAVDAATQTVRQISGALLAAFVTSIIGFLAIGCSSVEALRDFAALGTIGLGGSFLAAIFVLPAILVLIGNRPARSPVKPFRFGMDGLMRFSAKRQTNLRISAAAIALICIAARLTGPGLFDPDPDLTVMHPRPNAALDTEAEIARRFGISAGTILIELRAANDEQLVSLSHEVQRRLSAPAVKSAGIAGVYGLATWLPDPAVVALRRKQMTTDRAAAISADFTAAVNQSAFDPKSFALYGAFLPALLRPQNAPDLQTLARYPGLALDLLPASATTGQPTALTVVFQTPGEETRSSRDAAIEAIQGALAGLDGAIPTGLAVIGYQTDRAVRGELPRLLGIAVLLVAGYLLLHFRNWRYMCLSLLPAAFGLATLAGFMRFAGIRLNMINLIALPLLIGIDVDYGIYLVSLARKREARSPSSISPSPGNPGEGWGEGLRGQQVPIANQKPPSPYPSPGVPGEGIREDNSHANEAAHAVMVCATSVFVGYISLVTTSIPAVQSLGIIVATGVASCLAGTLFVLCPMLMENKR